MLAEKSILEGNVVYIPYRYITIHNCIVQLDNFTISKIIDGLS